MQAQNWVGQGKALSYLLYFNKPILRRSVGVGASTNDVKQTGVTKAPHSVFTQVEAWMWQSEGGQIHAGADTTVLILDIRATRHRKEGTSALPQLLRSRGNAQMTIKMDIVR